MWWNRCIFFLLEWMVFIYHDFDDVRQFTSLPWVPISREPVFKYHRWIPSPSLNSIKSGLKSKCAVSRFVPGKESSRYRLPLAHGNVCPQFSLSSRFALLIKWHHFQSSHPHIFAPLSIFQALSSWSVTPLPWTLPYHQCTDCYYYYCCCFIRTAKSMDLSVVLGPCCEYLHRVMVNDLVQRQAQAPIDSHSEAISGK